MPRSRQQGNACPLLTVDLQTISTITISVPALPAEKLRHVDSWLRSVLWEGEVPNQDPNPEVPIEIHRLKARLVFENGDVKLVQGVRDVFEIFDGEKQSSTLGENAAANDAQPPGGKIVLIGRGLREVSFERSFLDAIQDP